MMLRATGFAIAFSVFSGVAFAGEPQFQFAKDIKLPDIKQEELVSVPLDAEIYAATQDGMADLRVYDADGKPVPFLLRKSQTTKARKSRTLWNAQQLSAKPLDGNGLEITVQLGEKDPQPSGIRIVSPLKDFEHRIRIEASADGSKWEPAGKEAVIFDYSKFVDVRNDGVAIPDTAARHFRITIDNVTAEQQSELLRLTRNMRGGNETDRSEQVVVDRRPFRIDRVEFWRETESDQVTGDEKSKYPVKGFLAIHDPKKRQTILSIETDRQPLTSFEVGTTDRNFSRRVRVETVHGEGAAQTWQQIGDATISRIDFKNLNRESLAIAFPETRNTIYRVVIDEPEATSLTVSQIQSEGSTYSLLFLANPAKKYKVRYGDAEAEPIQIDTVALQELVKEKFQPVKAELLSQNARPAGPPPPTDWKHVLNSPLLLGSAAAVLVIVLGIGLYRAMQRMDKPLGS